MGKKKLTTPNVMRKDRLIWTPQMDDALIDVFLCTTYGKK
jgi:hypothetical protein